MSNNVVPMRSPSGDTPVPRVLPFNLEVEQALLGAVFINNAALAKVSGFLKAEHFYEPAHQRIYAVSEQMIGEDKPVTPIMLKTFLGDGDMGGMTVTQYLARLAAEATSVLRAYDYGRTVYDLAVRRQMIALADDLATSATDTPHDVRPIDLAAQASEGLATLLMEGAANTRREFSASAEALLTRVSRIMSGEVKNHSVSTGLLDLDTSTGGFRAGELWIIAGRPGMGKTAILTSMSRRAAQTGKGVLVFELEIPEEQIMARYLADLAWDARGAISYGAIMKGHVTDHEFERLDDARRHFQGLPLVVDISSRLKLSDIAARVRAEKVRMARKGVELGVVFIDYLRYITAGDRYKGNKVQEITEITTALKEMCKSQNICIVLLSQLNRGVEARDEKRPSIHDLKDSGSLEEDADVVALLYRENYYLEKSPEFRSGDPDVMDVARRCQNRMEIIVGKNRSGLTHTIPLWCDMASSSVASLSSIGGPA